MRFFLDETKNHWLFGHSYNVRILDELTYRQEMKLLGYLYTLEDNKRSKYTWYSEDTICFESEHERTLFVMKFSG